MTKQSTEEAHPLAGSTTTPIFSICPLGMHRQQLRNGNHDVLDPAVRRLKRPSTRIHLERYRHPGIAFLVAVTIIILMIDVITIAVALLYQ